MHHGHWPSGIVSIISQAQADLRKRVTCVESSVPMGSASRGILGLFEYFRIVKIPGLSLGCINIATVAIRTNLGQTNVMNLIIPEMPTSNN
jgi:hypothetical protein